MCFCIALHRWCSVGLLYRQVGRGGWLVAIKELCLRRAIHKLQQHWGDNVIFFFFTCRAFLQWLWFFNFTGATRGFLQLGSHKSVHHQQCLHVSFFFLFLTGFIHRFFLLNQVTWLLVFIVQNLAIHNWRRISLKSVCICLLQLWGLFTLYTVYDFPIAQVWLFLGSTHTHDDWKICAPIAQNQLCRFQLFIFSLPIL